MFLDNGIIPLFSGGAIFGICYAMSVTMTPYICREVFGNKDYDNIYSIVMIAFNLIGAFGATAWAALYQNLGWSSYFSVGMVNIVVFTALIFFTLYVGYKGRSKWLPIITGNKSKKDESEAPKESDKEEASA